MKLQVVIPTHWIYWVMHRLVIKRRHMAVLEQSEGYGYRDKLEEMKRSGILSCSGYPQAILQVGDFSIDIW